MNDIIKVENLSFAYTDELILKDISFDVPAGKFLAIAGPNGAGKTTLLNLMCDLLKPKKGKVKLYSKNIRSYSTKKLAKKIAVVHQKTPGAFDFTVEQTVAMGRTPYISSFGFETDSDIKIISEALDMTDTAGFAKRPLHKLSGGEQQRVFIARAMAQDSDILLLDEPTNFLDLRHQVKIYDLLKTAQLQNNKTIIAVTHDINLAAQYADIALLLGSDGSYQFGSSKDIFSTDSIEKTFKVKTFVGNVGEEKFFLPLGKLAKDASAIIPKTDDHQQK